MEQRRHNWGKPFSIISLVFGIIALSSLTFAYIPYVGFIFAIISLVFGALAIDLSIPGMIGSYRKNIAVIGLVFGCVSVTFAIICIFLYISSI